MIIEVREIRGYEDCTISEMYVDGEMFCHVLEDAYRPQKVSGFTRIGSGEYEIKKREVVSPMTERYRRKYHWFDWHLELQNVPEFQHIYIHIGNFPKDTDGCLLVGKWNLQPSFISNSTDTFHELYELISEKLLEEDVFIRILRR